MLRSRRVRMAVDSVEEVQRIEREIWALKDKIESKKKDLDAACDTLRIRINQVRANEPEAFEAEPWLGFWSVTGLPSYELHVEDEQAIKAEVFGELLHKENGSCRQTKELAS